MNNIEALKNKLPCTVEIFPDRVRIIDQSLLPQKLVRLDLQTVDEVVTVIKTMRVRGAQAIGAAGIGGMYLAARQAHGTHQAIMQQLQTAAYRLTRETRPTAVNLSWGVNKMLAAAAQAANQQVEKVLYMAARQILEAEVRNNQQIGQHGKELITSDMTILTHCNAGSLSSIWYGTATAPLFAAKDEGHNFTVLVDETRPQLQGSRLTAWEFKQVGIDFRIIVDGAAGSLMKAKRVSAVLVGADRIAANGDVANKIGTYPLAVLARENQIPFYVAAVEATIDRAMPTGEGIPIENRPTEDFWRYLQADFFDQSLPTLNPAFDITPAKYITKIITEKGILDPGKISAV